MIFGIWKYFQKIPNFPILRQGIVLGGIYFVSKSQVSRFNSKRDMALESFLLTSFEFHQPIAKIVTSLLLVLEGFVAPFSESARKVRANGAIFVEIGQKIKNFQFS